MTMLSSSPPARLPPPPPGEGGGQGRKVHEGVTQTITGRKLQGLREELYDRDAPLGDFGVQLHDLSAMKDLSFAFRRTVSRLTEMQSKDYLQVCRSHPAVASSSCYREFPPAGA
mmetsp:Transcript_9001/g.21819  ORF Transcript_9001/g.21819 Transcript_9001/m.21819 type:complete len:114 (+) Transcript_9001:107-448(+)